MSTGHLGRFSALKSDAHPQDPVVHAVAVLPHRAVEPYVNTAVSNGANANNCSMDYSVVAANEYSKGGIMVPSISARQQGKLLRFKYRRKSSNWPEKCSLFFQNIYIYLQGYSSGLDRAFVDSTMRVAFDYKHTIQNHNSEFNVNKSSVKI